ncbi:esterase/lipase family protein [Sediminibacillus albus]|uniref:Triacylglycerol lipase n=1 Tax=Sediminibacillus albus TaxID=407036 RepID=A0A1G8X6L1_9BACI|nr:hypothetical protein [Sediminibacillus albus]SDJ85390.1 triacylglycerol lipase [Sediminibacillus albus]
MLKKVLVTSFLFLFLLPSVIAAGSFGKDDPPGNPGEWYVGTTPANVLPENFPILFVHGLNSSSYTWWEENDMYDTSFQAGYETAFIDLYPSYDMWDNGALLAAKIEEMFQHFGKKVVVIAHSKGGIDAQAALVHYGAYPYVEKVITLSTPHHGSELADLAYSSWAGWLAGILGSQSDATYSLQTGYMDYFRSTTDSHALVNAVPFYTLGGTKRGSFGSSLYWGSLYLSSYGPNDGAVTVASSRLPSGTEISVGEWTHSTIKEGSATFSLFENYLFENGITSSTTSAQSTQATATPDAVSSAAYIRGGEFIGRHTESFYIENGAKEMTVDWISDIKTPKLRLENGSDKQYDSFTVEPDLTEYFAGAYHHTVTIPMPEGGKWSLEAVSSRKQSYLLNVTIDSPLNEELTLDVSGKDVKLHHKNKQLQVKTNATIEFYKNGKWKKGKVKIDGDQNSGYKLPKLGEGIYNMTMEVEGKKAGEKFQRTIIKSLYVNEDGEAY